MLSFLFRLTCGCTEALGPGEMTVHAYHVYIYMCRSQCRDMFVKRCGLSKPPAFERTSSLKVLACRHGEMLH